MPDKPKLLILGYARHGKDTVGTHFQQYHDYKFVSSSWFVAKEVMWDVWGCAVYDNIHEMFEDRVNHRVLWMQMISAYNTPDKTKTGRTMIERGYDMYVGMRRQDELDACRQAGVFDEYLWVDRSEHLPPEEGSMDIKYDPSYMVKIDNNGDLGDLYWNCQSVADLILNRR